MMDPKISLEVSRSFYAQMCEFREETERQHLETEHFSKRTSLLVQAIGTLLLIFVIVIGVYMTQLANQFVNIVQSIDTMGSRATTISELMADMTQDVAQMNRDVAYMQSVLKNMKKINGNVSSMEGEIVEVTESIERLIELGERGKNSVAAMNQKMAEINQTTYQMNLRVYQISRPMKAMPSH
jgi:methyl-accepting chemotaxis protein